MTAFVPINHAHHHGYYETSVQDGPDRRNKKGKTMPGTPRKATAASKGGSKSNTTPKSFEVELFLARETKNTYRFEAEIEDAAIGTLYILKSGWVGDAPKDGQKITVTVAVG